MALVVLLRARGEAARSAGEAAAVDVPLVELFLLLGLAARALLALQELLVLQVLQKLAKCWCIVAASARCNESRIDRTSAATRRRNSGRACARGRVRSAAGAARPAYTAIYSKS